jgi:GNAT superfamily N-acetyltransferase
MNIRRYKNIISDANALYEFYARIGRKEPRLDESQIIEFFEDISRSNFNHCWLVEIESRIIARLLITTPWWTKSEEFVLVFLDVEPAFQGKGIGTKLVERTRETLRSQPWDEVYVKIYQSDQQSVLFAKKHGLAPVMNFIVSEFDLSKEVETTVIDKLGLQGIKFLDGKKFIEKSPNDWQYLWWRLHCSIVNDVPSVVDWEEQPLEEFITMNINISRYNPLNWQFAINNDELIGCSGLSIYGGDSNVAFVDITGVVNGLRRRGIARALKIKSLLSAQKRGLQFIRTENEIENPMWLLNQSLGFYETNRRALYRGKI